MMAKVTPVEYRCTCRGNKPDCPHCHGLGVIATEIVHLDGDKAAEDARLNRPRGKSTAHVRVFDPEGAA